MAFLFVICEESGTDQNLLNIVSFTTVASQQTQIEKLLINKHNSTTDSLQTQFDNSILPLLALFGDSSFSQHSLVTQHVKQGLILKEQ